MSELPKAFKENPINDLIFPIRLSKSMRSFTFPHHYHKELEIIFVHDKTLCIEVDHVTYQLVKGDVLIIGCQHIHAYMGAIDDADFSLLLFDWTLLEKINKDKTSYGWLYPILYKVRSYSLKTHTPMVNQLEALLLLMHTEIKNKDKGYKFAITGYLYQLLTILIRNQSDETLRPSEIKSLEKEHNFLRLINDYIYKEYRSGCTLAAAAKTTGYSVFHFTRQFKKYTGLTFKQYLTNFQLSMIKEDLYDMDKSITSIAYDQGFQSLKTFNRVFKEHFHQSPSAFRKAINETYEATNGK